MEVLQSRRLLVLDDEQGLRDAYKSILSPIQTQIKSSRNLNRTELASFDVVYAANGEEALAALVEGMTSGRPLVGGFFDVRLGGGMDGIEVIRKAKEIDPRVLCVIVTAYQDREVEDISRFFGETFSDQWDFLNKPFTRPTILQKAHNLVADWNRRRREQHYLETLLKRRQEEDSFEEILTDVLTRIRNQILSGEEKGVSLEVAGALKRAAQSTDEALAILRQFLAEKDSTPSDGKPLLKVVAGK